MCAVLSVRSVVGKDYDDVWNCRKPYCIIMGGKGSKKSKTIALMLIYRMMKYPQANTLVIRATARSLKDSCYSDLMWAIDRWGVTGLWKGNTSPLQLTYLPTGQLILFKGADDPQKLASISVPRGVLCWVWFEEFYQFTDMTEFDMIDTSIRGRMPEGSGLFKQVIGTFNPWSEHTWIKQRFFDDPSPDVFTKVTTYRNNEFLGEEDVRKYEDLRRTNPRAAKIICDGNWGVSEGLVYDDWEVCDFDIHRVLDEHPDAKVSFGLDFGYAVDPNAFVAVAFDLKERKLWVFDEMYAKGMTNFDIAKRLCEMGYGKEQIWADSAEPKSIYELREGFVTEATGPDGKPMLFAYRLPGIRPALKGRDSILNGIARLKMFHMYVHPRCENVAMELGTYCYDQDEFGNFINKPIDDMNHAMDAMRYASVKIFVRAKGRVAEAKGGVPSYRQNRRADAIDDGEEGSAPAVTHSRRVFSTVDAPSGGRRSLVSRFMRKDDD